MTIRHRTHIAIGYGMAFAAFMHACFEVFNVSTSRWGLAIWFVMGAVSSTYATRGQR